MIKRFQKHYAFFCHNFADYISGTEIFIPWSDHVKYSSTDSRAAYCAPEVFQFHSIFMKVPAIDTSHDMTIRIYKVSEGTQSLGLLGYHMFAIADSDDYSVFKKTNLDDFGDIIPHTKGDNIKISIEASVAPTVGSVSWYITSVWEYRKRIHP